MYPTLSRLLYLFCSLRPVIVRGSEAISSSSSFSKECNLSGLCLDFMLNDFISVSLDNCIMFGRSTPGATWVSFNRELGACSALQACDNLDESDLGSMSSGVNCTVCSISGTCLGDLLAVNMADNADNCLGQCRSEKVCAWYSFNAESRSCYLFQSCPDLVVDEHENWVSGEAACTTAASTLTPAPTTTTRPTTSNPAPAEDQEIVWIDGMDGAVRLGKLICNLCLSENNKS